MKYATWKLDFTDPVYGTGPEEEIFEQGFYAESAYVSDEVQKGGTILGYFTGSPVNLKKWNFTELSAEEALSFVSAIDDTAYFLDDNKIGTIVDEENLNWVEIED